MEIDEFDWGVRKICPQPSSHFIISIPGQAKMKQIYMSEHKRKINQIHIRLHWSANTPTSNGICPKVNGITDV